MVEIPRQEYRGLLDGYLRQQGEQFFRSGFCDYYMASLTARQETASAATATRAQQAT